MNIQLYVAVILNGLMMTSVHASHDLVNGDVIFVSIAYRHGERTPSKPYPNDPYKNESSWPVLFSQLTNRGKQQQYELGQWLRRRYSKFLPSQYSKNDIYIRSTDADRTIMSAQANLAGLYPPEGEQVWNSKVNWMPIPVHTVPRDKDYLLNAQVPCEAYTREYSKVLESPEYRQLDRENQELYRYLEEKTGLPVKCFTDVREMYDTLLIEKNFDKPLPDWITPVFFSDELTPIALRSFTVMVHNRIMQRLRAGPLIGEITRQMQAKSNSSLKPDRKMWMYSMHDTNMVNFMITLGIFQGHLVPYATVIAIELRKNNLAQYVVTVYYKEPAGEPKFLKIPGCDLMCPLDKFAELMADVIPEDWHKECAGQYSKRVPRGNYEPGEGEQTPAMPPISYQ